MQSTDDTVVMKFIQADKVNPREDDMIARAHGLKAEIPSAFVTFFEGSGTQNLFKVRFALFVSKLWLLLPRCVVACQSKAFNWREFTVV